MCRIVSTTKNYLVPNVNSGKVDRLCSKGEKIKRVQVTVLKFLSRGKKLVLCDPKGGVTIIGGKPWRYRF